MEIFLMFTSSPSPSNFRALREGKSNFQWFQVRREKNANVNLESCSQILEETWIFKDLLRTDKMWNTELTRIHITIFHWNIIFLSIVITIQSDTIKIRIIILQNKSRVVILSVIIYISAARKGTDHIDLLSFCCRNF